MTRSLTDSSSEATTAAGVRLLRSALPSLRPVVESHCIPLPPRVAEEANGNSLPAMPVLVAKHLHVCRCRIEYREFTLMTGLFNDSAR